MTSENIRELLRREPFVPFRLMLSSGRHYDIVDPELAVAMKNEVFLAFADGERWAHVPLLHIAAIETLRNGKRNGSRGRKRD